MRTATLLAIVATAALAAPGPVPRPSPPFSIQRPGAPTLKVEDYRGKVVVITLIDTNCQHCQVLTQQLSPVAKEYAPRGVQFLECAFNDGAHALVPGFIQKFQPSFPVGYCTRAAVEGYIQRSVIDTRPLYVPHMVIVDQKGVIQGDYAGEGDFMKDTVRNTRAMLDKLLAGAAPTPKKGAAKTGKK